MNAAIISSTIGTVGAAFVAVLIVFLKGLRDDIRAIGGRIDRFESRLGNIDQSLARIETVQEQHSRTLADIPGHGERIAAVEGAAAAVS